MSPSLQAEAAFQLGVESVVRQRDDALGLALFLGPHDRRALALQRQDRERPRRQEMLLGAAVMIALMRHGGDDAGLIVVPADAADAGAPRGSPSARRRRRPEASRRWPSPAGQLHVDAIRRGFESGHRIGAEHHAVGLRALDQRIDQRRVLDHMRERLARRDLAAERQIGRPHRVLQLGVGDDHVEDRLRAVGDLVPDAERFEQPARRRRDRRSARVAGVAA